jgi:hypothetical protein
VLYIEEGFNPPDIENLTFTLPRLSSRGRGRFGNKRRNLAKALIYYVFSISPGLKSGAIA